MQEAPGHRGAFIKRVLSATIVVSRRSRIIRGPNVMEMCPMTLAQVRANHGAVDGALAEPSAGLWWRRGLRVHPSSSPSKNDGYTTSNCNVGTVSDVRFNIHVIDSKCGQDDLKVDLARKDPVKISQTWPYNGHCAECCRMLLVSLTTTGPATQRLWSALCSFGTAAFAGRGQNGSLDKCFLPKLLAPVFSGV